MLIPLHELIQRHNLTLRGVLHVGAHECEERGAYNNAGVSDDNIIWLEGNPHLVQLQQQRDTNVRIYQALVSDEDNPKCSLIVTNNGQSSSILELGTHRDSYPSVVEIQRLTLPSITIDTFLQQHPEIPQQNINFVNMDIQGAELKALRGMTRLLPQCQALYLEVNTRHVYQGCALLDELDGFLLPHGFQRVELKMTNEGWGDALYIRV